MTMAANPLNAKRDVKAFQAQFAIGKANERRVKNFLLSLGFKVSNATLEEDKYQDIDIWLGDTPVSLKAQHKALKYADRCMYFELQQKLTGVNLWEDSWFYYGKADKYLITQGDELILLDKKAIVDYVEENGWYQTRTLSWQAKAYLGGSYRYDNALCAFIRYGDVPKEKVWVMPSESKEVA